MTQQVKADVFISSIFNVKSLLAIFMFIFIVIFELDMNLI